MCAEALSPAPCHALQEGGQSASTGRLTPLQEYAAPVRQVSVQARRQVSINNAGQHDSSSSPDAQAGGAQETGLEKGDHGKRSKNQQRDQWAVRVRLASEEEHIDHDSEADDLRSLCVASPACKPVEGLSGRRPPGVMSRSARVVSPLSRAAKALARGSPVLRPNSAAHLLARGEGCWGTQASGLGGGDAEAERTRRRMLSHGGGPVGSGVGWQGPGVRERGSGDEDEVQQRLPAEAMDPLDEAPMVPCYLTPRTHGAFRERGRRLRKVFAFADKGPGGASLFLLQPRWPHTVYACSLSPLFFNPPSLPPSLSRTHARTHTLSLARTHAHTIGLSRVVVKRRRRGPAIAQQARSASQRTRNIRVLPRTTWLWGLPTAGHPSQRC